MVVLEARGLSRALAGESWTHLPMWTEEPGAQPSDLGGPLTPFALPDPYVKIQLMLNRRKWKRRKTSARKGTATPYFNEGFTFLVPFGQIQVGCLEEGAGENLTQGRTDRCLSPPPPTPLPASTQSVDLVLAVWARGPQLRAEPVGKVLLGPRASGQPLQHWADMGGPSPSGTACSQPGRWTRPWPCSPACVCPCLASEGSPGPGPPRAHCPRARGNKRLPSTMCLS